MKPASPLDSLERCIPPDLLPVDPIVRDPRFVSLAATWDALVDRYLPRGEPQDSFYRYDRPLADSDPAQGWKLHVSATLQSGPAVLAAVAPVLRDAGVRFKALGSLLTLKRVNCGSFFGYRQVGKAIAAFARSEGEAVALADALDQATRGLIGPRVPSDLPCRADGIVFYRYGAFRPLSPGSQRCDAIRTPGGDLVPDRREPGHAVPDWIDNPFPVVAGEADGGPIVFGFLPLDAISLRGKGAVHHALDLRESPPRLVVLKHGIRFGEADLDGRDGYTRLADEISGLAALADAGIAVPRVLAQFQHDGKLYAALEHIEGVSLQERLMESAEPLALAAGLDICLQAAQIVARMHRAGWAWRDCKPQNLIVSDQGLLRAIDFEETCRLDDRGRPPAGTPAYLPPEWPDPDGLAAQDVYALGVTVHQTLSRALGYSIAAPLRSYRDDTPSEVENLVERLLSPDRHHRPAADVVVRILERASLRQLSR